MTIEGGAYYASCTYDSPVGALTLAAGEEGLKGLWLEGQKYFAGTLDRPMREGANDHLGQAIRWLDAYFAGESPAIATLSLAPNGSDFQQAVWGSCSATYRPARCAPTAIWRRMWRRFWAKSP